MPKKIRPVNSEPTCLNPFLINLLVSRQTDVVYGGRKQQCETTDTTAAMPLIVSSQPDSRSTADIS